MKRTPFPGYENHTNSYLTGELQEIVAVKQANGAAMMQYTLPEGWKMDTIEIESAVEGESMKLRLFVPTNLPAGAGMILDVHGGGFVGGNIEIDNARCIGLAREGRAVVASVEYHLSNKEVHFPTPMLDCYKAYKWLQAHAADFGCDGTKIGLHGSSAGGTLCGGLALYLRDHGEQQPVLTILNCACYETGLQETMAFQQNIELEMGAGVPKGVNVEAAYLGGFSGQTPSYWAFPGYCHDVGGLGAHFIIAAEYDTLRDGALKYARRLLNAGVPTDVLVAGRLAHCYSSVPGAATDLLNAQMGLYFRRECGLL